MAIKAIFGFVLVTAMTAAGLYVHNLIEANAILEQNVETLELAREAHQKAMVQMKEDLKLKQHLAEDRETKRKKANIKAMKLQQELMHVLNDTEKECYTAEVPNTVIDAIFGSVLSTTENSTDP